MPSIFFILRLNTNTNMALDSRCIHSTTVIKSNEQAQRKKLTIFDEMRLDAWLKTMRTHLQLLEHDDWNSQTSIGTRCVVIFSLQLLSITFGVFFALHHYRHLDLCTFLGTKYFQILFGLTKHTHTIYLPSLLRLGMVAFVIRMFVLAAARCVRTSCTQNLTDIRNQFSARIFFIHRLKVLFTVVQALLCFHLVLYRYLLKTTCTPFAH